MMDTPEGGRPEGHLLLRQPDPGRGLLFGRDLFTTIPYDAGWTVKVDGQRVETYGVADALLAFDVGAGEHTVELSYSTPGLLMGIFISVVCLILLILVVLLTRGKLRLARLQALFGGESARRRGPESAGEEDRTLSRRRRRRNRSSRPGARRG